MSITYVSAEAPIRISSSTTAKFDEIVIQSGGYIEITCDCHFTAAAITKEASTDQGEGEGTDYDIRILGIEGAEGQMGAVGQVGNNGVDGLNLKCTEDHAKVRHPPTDGSRAPSPDEPLAANRGNAGTDGGKGKPGPTVTFEITRALMADLSLLNRGGDGGLGGKGGTGGTGGKGGNGGNGGVCQTYKRDGANGGAGGNGNAGGPGGSGGDGGDGGNLTISYPRLEKAYEILVSNYGGLAGASGYGGDAGPGGAGGAGGQGSHGSQDGAAGPSGQLGSVGEPGKTNQRDGQKGHVEVNGKRIE